MTQLTLGSLRSRAGHLHVTTKDINQGVPNDAQQCAVAVALEGLLPSSAEVVAVNHEYITIGAGGRRWHAATPATARDFIMAFDDADTPEARLDLLLEADAGRLQWDLAWAEGNAPALAGCYEVPEL